MHFPSCCSLQPPWLLCPLPGLLGGFHPAHPQDKGVDPALGAPQPWSGSPNLLWWSGCATNPPTPAGMGSLQLCPKSAPCPSSRLQLNSFFSICALFILFSVTRRCSQPSKATQDLPCPGVVSPTPPAPSSPTPRNLGFTLEVMTATTPGATFSFGDSCKKRWEWSTSHRAAHPLLKKAKDTEVGEGGISIQIQTDTPPAFPPFSWEF